MESLMTNLNNPVHMIGLSMALAMLVLVLTDKYKKSQEFDPDYPDLDRLG